MLYEMLTGSVPFGGKTSNETITQLHDHVPSSPRKLNKSLSRPLAAICMKALTKDPKERYQSALELVQDLQLYEASMPTTAHRPSIPERVGNSMVRHPVRATALVTLGLVSTFLIGIVGSAFQEMAMSRRFQLSLASEFVEGMAQHTAELDSEFEEIRMKLAGDELAVSEERRSLEQRLAELSALRQVRAKQRDLALAHIFPLLLREEDESRQLRERWWQAYLADLDRLIADGQYYFVHYDVRSRLVNFEWSPEERDELLRIKTRVESLLAAEYGEGFTPPDWASDDPPMTLPEYLKESVQALPFPFRVRAMGPSPDSLGQ
jgi:hypothetical protein